MTLREEPQPLAGLARELARLIHHLSALEVRLAGVVNPDPSEWLARLQGASRHLAAAQCALAGVAVASPPRLGPEPSAGDDSLQGSSRAVPIQDLLCFLATSKKSGVLRVESERERFLLQLDHGAVVYATGDTPPSGEGLKELLAERGEHSTEFLGQLPESTRPGVWFDRNLVGTSWIARDSLVGALQQQTRLAFFRLCAARETRFRFYEGAEIQNLVPVRHSAMELLLEFSRTLDERNGRDSTGACGNPFELAESPRGSTELASLSCKPASGPGVG